MPQIKKPSAKVKAADETALLVYMQSRYGGLRIDRSAANYALEFLKTAEENLTGANKRLSASLTADAIRARTKRLLGDVESIEASLRVLDSVLDELEATRSGVVPKG